jgi:hypothetical protein
LQGFLRGTGPADMVPENRPVKHVNDAGQIEEPVLSGNVPVLQIGLPKLIGTGDDAIYREPTGRTMSGLRDIGGLGAAPPRPSGAPRSFC